MAQRVDSFENSRTRQQTLLEPAATWEIDESETEQDRQESLPRQQQHQDSQQDHEHAERIFEQKQKRVPALLRRLSHEVVGGQPRENERRREHARQKCKRRKDAEQDQDVAGKEAV